jgi:hypothetical protein
MTNLLILLTLSEPVRNQYRDRLQARFPELSINLVDHHSKVGPRAVLGVRQLSDRGGRPGRTAPPLPRGDH